MHDDIFLLFKKTKSFGWTDQKDKIESFRRNKWSIFFTQILLLNLFSLQNPYYYIYLINVIILIDELIILVLLNQI